MQRTLLSVVVIAMASIASACPAAEPKVMDLWQGTPPGPLSKASGEEVDRTKPADRLIAGRKIIKLGNVSKPQMHVFLPASGKRNGGAVVICPGGGFSILAWDLEGTEVAEWLNELGFAAVVLKYRVPTRHHGPDGMWRGPVMDAQRALSLTREHSKEWGLDKNRIGVLGFSAGGQTAALATVKQGQRMYEAKDARDKQSCAADFALLIYPSRIVNAEGELEKEYVVNEKTAPMFFAHAADDRVTCLSSVMLFAAMKKAGRPAELHVFANGGHGYGLRPTETPVTHWSKLAAAWLKSQQLDKSK